MHHSLAKGFRIGEYTILPLMGQVSGPSGSTHLPPKAVDVLLCLAEAPGQVVGHEQILEAVWGDPGGSHDALSHAVSEIRRQLGDRADNPVYVQTIPKRGYRLLTGVEPLEAGAGSDAPNEGSDRDKIAALWTALQKRRVVRASIAYAAVSWLLLQVAEVVFDALAFPDWSMRVFVVVLGAGFLVAVVIAWVYQVVPENDGSTTRPPRHLHKVIDIGIIAVLALGLGLLSYRQFVHKPILIDESGPATTVAVEGEISDFSVAVLRFANLGADPKFSDGLSENLLHLLTRVREISVPSRTTTWRATEKDSNIADIASRLRVRYVLEGSVQQEDEQIRVFAQLIDGQTGNHIWSDNYDKELTADNFFATQDDIALTVAQKIQTTISDESRAFLKRAHTSSLAALDAYLDGQLNLRKPKTSESLTAAAESFENALAIDSDFVEAMAGLCEANLAWYDFTRDDTHFVTAESACLQAATTDNTLGEVYAAMGQLYRIAGRYAEAEMNLLKAIELLPGSAPILEQLGRTYRAANKLILAESTLQRAIQAEPGSWSVYKSMGNFLFRTGRYKEAIPYYRQVITLEGDSSPGYNNLAVTYFMLGRFGDANAAWSHVLTRNPTRLTYLNYGNSLYYSREYAESARIYEKALEMDANDHRVWGNLAQSLRFVSGREHEAAPAWERAAQLAEENLEVNPNNTETLTHLATAYARLEKWDLAERSLGRALALGWENPNTSFFVALTYHLMGREEETIRELERAVLMGFPTTLIAWDPDFQALSTNRRYIALLETAESRPGS